MRNEVVVQGGQPAAENGVGFGFFGAAVVEPGAPAEGRGGEVEGHAGGHLEVELVQEVIGVRHDGLRVLLLLLHAHVHVPHRHLVVQLRHPAVWVLPRCAVEAELLRLLWGLRWARWWWRRRLVVAPGYLSQTEQRAHRWGIGPVGKGFSSSQNINPPYKHFFFFLSFLPN